MQDMRNRSRSPIKVDSVGRRRDNDVNKNQTGNGNSTGHDMNMMNQMMMSNMYSQGNMMMAGGMYPNMMMPGMMGAGMMPTGTGMEMMPTTGMEMMPQASMDMSAMGTAASMPSTGSSMDMNMMGGMMMDPSMMGMYGMTGDMSTAQVERKEIVLKHCKLTPPDPGTPQPPRRSRPPGCRTIFVGGLPDKIRESIVRDIFENYGRIHTLRLSKKNFCHIRFDRETCVDGAMSISGYRIKLTDEKEKDADDMDEDDDSHATTGWLHVDYAASRDDQNEFERRQRQALRVQQAHLQQLEAGAGAGGAARRRRSPSPARPQPYSTAAVVQLAEKVKSEDHFAAALPTLLSWLEKGECSKKNANQFYSMIQATNSHIRRLFNEKMQSEEELQNCKERVRANIENVIGQLEQVAKVFVAAAHQRVWDHFTKPQRKNIETWQKMTQEFSSLKDEFNEKFYGEDNEFNGFNNKQSDTASASGSSEEVQQLKRENESLQFQLEAYKNEVDVIKADAQKEMEKFKAQFIARQALQGAIEMKNRENESLQFQLEAYKNEVDVIKADAQKEMEKFKAQFIARQALQGAIEMKNPPLPTPQVKPPPPPPLPGDDSVRLAEAVPPRCGEARLIGVMSAFLQVHPHGASLDYVVSYVRALFPKVTQATVHHVLQKHSDVFQRKTSGVGANIENSWSFVAFLDNKDEADSS